MSTQVEALSLVVGSRSVHEPAPETVNRSIFFVGLILAGSCLLSPPIALLAGLIFGFVLPHPFPIESKRLSKFLLQASVVALGFGMNLHEVLRAGRSGFLYTAVSITVAMLLGLGLGYLLQVRKKSAFLISAEPLFVVAALSQRLGRSPRLARTRWLYLWERYSS